MEQFRLGLERKRNIYLVFIIITLLVVVGGLVYIAMGNQLHGEGHIESFVSGSKFGFVFGMLSVLIVGFYKTNKALKDDVLLKKMYVEQNDERTIMIREKALSTSSIYELFALALVGIITGFFNETISLTLCLAVLLLAIIKIIIYKIYEKKF